MKRRCPPGPPNSTVRHFAARAPAVPTGDPGLQPPPPPRIARRANTRSGSLPIMVGRNDPLPCSWMSMQRFCSRRRPRILPRGLSTPDDGNPEIPKAERSCPLAASVPLVAPCRDQSGGPMHAAGSVSGDRPGHPYAMSEVLTYEQAAAIPGCHLSNVLPRSPCVDRDPG